VWNWNWSTKTWSRPRHNFLAGTDIGLWAISCPSAEVCIAIGGNFKVPFVARGP
jgi:hypothetical protein